MNKPTRIVRLLQAVLALGVIQVFFPWIWVKAVLAAVAAVLVVLALLVAVDVLPTRGKEIPR